MILECLLASFISDSGNMPCHPIADIAGTHASGRGLECSGAQEPYIFHMRWCYTNKVRRSCTVRVEEMQAETKYVHVLYVLHTSYLLLPSSVFFIYPACPSQCSFSSARVWFFIDTVEM